jgi:hypothetical protein
MRRKSLKIGLLGWLILLVCNASYGWRTPVSDPISSDYGPRNYGGYDWHGGIDYASSQGTPVYPAEDGEIRVIGVDDRSGYYVVVQGSQRIAYCHLSQRYLVSGYPCVAIEWHGGVRCIVFRNSQGTATRAYSSQPGIQIDNIRTQNTVNKSTDFARTGATGQVTVLIFILLLIEGLITHYYGYLIPSPTTPSPSSIQQIAMTGIRMGG